MSSKDANKFLVWQTKSRIKQLALRSRDLRYKAKPILIRCGEKARRPEADILI